MTETIAALRDVMLRDLDKLEKEIQLFPAEEALWKTGGQISNSAGNLCLHLCGNLQHYLGKQLGGLLYERNRAYEFSAKNVSRTELLQQIAAARNAVERTMTSLTPPQLLEDYPEEVFGKPMTTVYFLIHLAGHLNYHLGQINYHRRLIG